jgi:hypothetical protein
MIRAFVVALLVTSTSLVAAPVQQGRERPVPFRVGEKLTFDVSWSSYLTAGTVSIAVQEKRPSFNSLAYYIVAEARPTTLLSKLYTLYYKMDTLLDAYTLLPQRGSLYSEEGRRHRYTITQFDHAARRASFERRTETSWKSDFQVSPVVQDALSALYVIRAVTLKAGDRMTMPISDNGGTFRAQLSVAGTERVKAPIGEMNAWKVSATVSDEANRQVGRPMTFWISDDARRLPVKVQLDLAVGSFVVALRQAD